MRSIIVKSSFFYITHFVTFSAMPFYGAIAGRRGSTVLFALLAFVWLASSVFWSERSESYAFLRLLPVRDRDVVRAKLALGLVAAFVYWAWLVLLALVSWGVSTEFFARFSLLNLVGSAWPPLVALCYLGIWRRGARTVAFPFLTLMAAFLIVLLPVANRFFPPRYGDLGLGLKAAPWFVQVLLPVMGVGVFLVLARMAPRIKRNNDEHLQLP
jgi:hypothetical protein